MKRSLLLAVILMATTMVSNRTLASGCGGPELKTIATVDGESVLETQTIRQHLIKVFYFKEEGTAFVLFANVLADGHFLDFSTNQFETRRISPEEIVRTLQTLPAKIPVKFVKTTYEVEYDDCGNYEVGTKFVQTAYQFAIRHGMGEKMKFNASTDRQVLPE